MNTTVPTPEEVVGQDITGSPVVRPANEVPIPAHPVEGQMIPDPTPQATLSATGKATPSPNANDYAVLSRSEFDPTRFKWTVYSGNHFATHTSRVTYSSKATARRAIRREHPGVPIKDRTQESDLL